MNSPKGSIWRKWDLHIHTKGTSKNDQFISIDFDAFCVTLFKKALENEIYAIGITDYFSISNYLKVQQFILNINSNINFTDEEKDEIKKIFIIPNIELRMIPVTDRGKLVNIHCIFNPKYVENLDNDFFNSIQCTGSGRRYQMNRSGIINLGASMDVSLGTDDEKYQKGVENFVVSHESLQKLWDENETFRENTIIAVSNSNCDGASAFQKHFDFFEGVETGSLDGLRRSIYHLSQVIFSGNPEDKEYFLGKKVDDEFIVKTKCGSLKPCIHGSDAHNEDNLFKPEQNRYCWIKADTTFEGLKQIIYEPNDRVFIGEEPSVLERVRDHKTKYINSLKINNKSGQKAKRGKWFESLNIEFNSELVAIIGNKGSGKSAISDIIGVLGNTGSAGENHKNLSFLNNSINQKKFRQKGFSDAFEAKMEWEDGSYVAESLDKDIDITQAEKVKYLPQNYFESLTNDLEEEGFEKTLKSVIFLHIPEPNRYGKTTFDDLEKYKSSSIQKDLPILESDLEKLSADIVGLEEKNHSDNKKHIENLLEEKEKELTEHEKNKPKEVKNPTDDKNKEVDKLKEEKIKKIEELNINLSVLANDIEDKKNQKNKIVSDKEALQQIHDDLTRFEGQIKTYKDQNKEKFQGYGFDINKLIEVKFDSAIINTEINRKKDEQIELEKTFKTLKEIENECGGDKKQFDKAKKLSLIIQKNEIEEKISSIKKELSKPERDYQEYKEKLKKWEVLKKAIEGDAENPKTMLKTVAFYKDEKEFIEQKLPAMLKQKRQERVEKAIVIFKKKKEIIELYEEFKKSIDEQIAEDGEFSKKFKMDIDVSFKEDKNFRKNFLDFINQNKGGSFYGKINGDKKLSEIFDEKDLSNEEDIRIILQTIIEFLEKDQRQEVKEEEKKRDISDQINQVEEFYKLVFSLDYLKPNYELKLDGKPLEKLSPGEKGALLLVFYLMVDKEDTPLIIDQPEDNLDNKSVFEVLTHFIRFAKKRRQIIIVTHNPNLAVGADAEQIIYVHLDKNQDYEFSYQTGAIENPILNKRIVEILEGTQPAFDKRKLKYLKEK
jgi:ABC-type lipoprotein export system ATPase subunit